MKTLIILAAVAILTLATIAILGCGISKPITAIDPLRQTAAEAAIQKRLENTAAFLITGNTTVVWKFMNGGEYRFDATNVPMGLVQWEDGDWWITHDEAGEPSLAIYRKNGAYLAKDKSWVPLGSYPVLMPFLMIGRSISDNDLSIRLGTGSGLFTYRVVPLDSLAGYIEKQ